MKVEPIRNYQRDIALNNVCIITVVFAFILFGISIFFQFAQIAHYEKNMNLKDVFYKKVVVNNKPKIYKVYFAGKEDFRSNVSVLLEEEASNSNRKNIIYSTYPTRMQFFSEQMSSPVYLTFNEKGTYYIKVGLDYSTSGVTVHIAEMYGSYVIFITLMEAMFFFALLLFLYANGEWFKKYMKVCADA